MSLPKSFDIPQTLYDFIDNLNESQAAAKRKLDQSKSLAERASSAYDKARLTEDTLKNYYDKLVQTNKYSREALRELNSTLIAICRIATNTGLTATETKKLTIEVGEVLVYAENLKKQLLDFRKCVADSPKLVACVDAVLKTLTPNGAIEELVTAFQNAIITLKKAILLHQLIIGECGLQSRINESALNFETCCLPLNSLKEDTQLDKCCEHPMPEGCTVLICPDIEANTIIDPNCQCEYDEFKSTMPVKSICVKFNISGYANDLEGAYGNAQTLRKRAYEWMICTKDAAELAESRYISCKAAYEAALQARKC